MGTLQDIMREERERLAELAGQYEKELDQLPRGSIAAKKIRNNYYYYLAYRNGKQVKFEYIGKEGSAKLAELRAKIERRKLVESRLKLVRANIKELAKTLRE
ncbi:MAG: hypothetical protein JW820_15850 [Spirochaetales bacterium]|nr:hypothetical protein [Spirochaetales bacterium]